MSPSVRRTSALALTVALVGAGLAISSPAVGAGPVRALPLGVSLTNAGTLAAPDYTLEIDCAVIPDSGSYDFATEFDYAEIAIPLGSVVTVLTSGCTDAFVAAYDTNETRATPAYTPVGGADDGVIQELGSEWAQNSYVSLDTSEFLVSPNTQFTALAGDFPDGYFTVYAPLAVEVADPQGDLLEELTMEIPAAASADLVVADDPLYYDAFGDLELGGVTDCGITAGNHFYDEAEVVIENAGIYSFRIADLDPASQDVDFSQDARYLEDPFLALYSSFNPADGHQGVVGCNDDSDLDGVSFYYITSSGTMMSDRYSQYTVELQPGTYTLVLTSYDDETAFGLTSAPVAATSERPEKPKGDFSPTAFGVDENATIQVWYAESELAATGPSPVSGGMLAAGLALMTLGGLVFATRRLWSRA